MSTGQSLRDYDLNEVAEYVVEQKLPVEETEQLVLKHLKQAQKSQKANYGTKYYGQQVQAGAQVWYRN